MQREGLDQDLDVTSIDEIQGWLRDAAEGLGGVQRNLSEKERTIVGKRQLIEANKAQYSKVSSCDDPVFGLDTGHMS